MPRSAKTDAKEPSRKLATESAAKPVILSSNPLADAFVPYPLFPPFVLLDDHQDLLQPLNNAVRARLDTLDSSLKVYGTWRLGIDFLAMQCQLPEFTARHYKILCPVIEAMMHWSWSIQCKPLSEWQETDAREFMSFAMRPPMTWISQTGGTRYVLRHKTEFAVKPINDNWRPITRTNLATSASIFVLGTGQHRNIFLNRGREFFEFILDNPDKNPFKDLRARDFEVRHVSTRMTFTPAQLRDLMTIAKSLAEIDPQSQSLLLVAAIAVYSDIPFRAMGSTPELELTFSSFKVGSKGLQKNPGSKQPTPDWFESPRYPRRLYPLNSEFADYFHQYAQFRHALNHEISRQSFLLPLMADTGGYSDHTLLDRFSKFTGHVLTKLKQSPLAAKDYWQGCEHFRAGASITFLELRKSAKAANWVPEALTLVEPPNGEDTWPNIGITKHLAASQWMRNHLSLL